jgi:hypothetical protein
LNRHGLAQLIRCTIGLSLPQSGIHSLAPSECIRHARPQCFLYEVKFQWVMNTMGP